MEEGHEFELNDPLTTNIDGEPLQDFGIPVPLFDIPPQLKPVEPNSNDGYHECTPPTQPPHMASLHLQIPAHADASLGANSPCDDEIRHGLSTQLRSMLDKEDYVRVLNSSIYLSGRTQTNTPFVSRPLAGNSIPQEENVYVDPSGSCDDTRAAPSQEIKNVTHVENCVREQSVGNLSTQHVDEARVANNDNLPVQQAHPVDAGDGAHDISLHNSLTQHHERTNNFDAVVVPSQSVDMLPSTEQIAFNTNAETLPTTPVLSYPNGLFFDTRTQTLISTENEPENEPITCADTQAWLQRKVYIGKFDVGKIRAAKRRREEEGEITLETHKEQGNGSGCTSGPINNSNDSFEVLEETKMGPFSLQKVLVHKPPVCSHCERPAPSSHHLAEHIKQWHRPKPKKRAYRKQERVRILRCELCNLQLTNEANLRRHQDIVHEGDVVATCDQCNAPFSSRHGYVIHMRDMHGVVPDSVRERFGADVYQERARKKHKSAETKGDLTFHICTSCPYFSPCKGNVVRHIRLSHMELREHECEVCHLDFKTKSNMQIHYTNKHRDLLKQQEDTQS